MLIYNQPQVLDPPNFFRRLTVRQLFLFLIAILVLNGCEGGNSSSRDSSVPRPDDTTMRIEPDTSPNAKNLSIDPLLPPGGTERPPKTGELGRERTADGLPILQPKGANLQQIFAEDVKDPMVRIKRLENAVVEIRRDLDSALPAINRLVSIEGDLQELVKQLHTLVGDDGKVTPRIAPPDRPDTGALIDDLNDQAPGSLQPLEADELKKSDASMPKAPPKPVVKNELPPITVDKVEDESDGAVAGVAVEPPPPATKPMTPMIATPKISKQIDLNPVMKPVAPKPVKPDIKKIVEKTVAKVESKTQSTAISVSGIRIGTHQDKTRIVIDSPTPVKISQDLDNTERVLVVDLKDVAVTKGAQNLADNKLVKSIALQTAKSGGQAVFELKKDTAVKSAMVIPPQGEQKFYRVVIDLAP